MPETIYTFVEHSGLPGCIEEVPVTTKRDLAFVQRNGGTTVEGYKAATDRCMVLNYPPERDDGQAIVPFGQHRFGKPFGRQRLYLGPQT